MSEVILEMKGITKVFGTFVANDSIDFDLRKGEVHALLGENVAGKTTLMNVLYGIYHAEKGEVIYKGEKLVLSNPKDAIKKGIGMVHQHFMLVPPMTVLENIILGQTDNLKKVDLKTPQPGHQSSGLVGRGAAEGGARQGAVPRGGSAHPRRADSRADAERGQ